jgi:hypothetical protein
MLTIPQIDEAYRAFVRERHDPGYAATTIVDLLQVERGTVFPYHLRVDLERLFTEGCSYSRIETAFDKIKNYREPI